MRNISLESNMLICFDTNFFNQCNLPTLNCVNTNIMGVAKVINSTTKSEKMHTTHNQKIQKEKSVKIRSENWTQIFGIMERIKQLRRKLEGSAQYYRSLIYSGGKYFETTIELFCLHTKMQIFFVIYIQTYILNVINKKKNEFRI